MDLFSQDINPVTGDIGFNPALFGLSLKDIDQVASIKLKAALTSWGLALTQEQYREVRKISETKYQWLDAQSGIFNWSVLPAVDMSSKDPWLYLTQEYMWYWTGTEWSSYIGNNGNFEFQGNATNYIRWNGTALDIRGVLQMIDWTSIEDYVQANWTKPMVNSQYDSSLDKYKQWLNTWDLLPYTIPGSATWVYLTSAWLFGVKNWVNQFSISTATGDAMFRWTVYASWWSFDGSISVSPNGNIRWWQTAFNTWSWFWIGDDWWTKKFSIWNWTNSLTWNWTQLSLSGNISSNAIITWWSLVWSIIKTQKSGQRVEITSANNKVQIFNPSGTEISNYGYGAWPTGFNNILWASVPNDGYTWPLIRMDSARDTNTAYFEGTSTNYATIYCKNTSFNRRALEVDGYAYIWTGLGSGARMYFWFWSTFLEVDSSGKLYWFDGSTHNPLY